MKHLLIIAIVLLASVLAGCNLIASPAPSPLAPTKAPTLEFNQPTSVVLATPKVSLIPQISPALLSHQSSQQAVLDLAFMIISALKEKDMATLSQFVSPHMGLRISPYAAIQEKYPIFTPDQVTSLKSDTTLYIWGAYYGSGETIELTFADYYAKFIYDVDFANAPQIALNHRLGVSTTLDNSADYYPGAMIVEFYFPGFDPTLEGMDWRSLRLVFIQENGTWYLVGVIHDQWTT